MATLTDDIISSAATLHAITAADPVLYVPADRLIWKTGGTGRAIQFSASGGDLLIAGTVVSSANGVAATVAISAPVAITLTQGGYLEAEDSGIVLTASAAIKVTNAGTIIGERAILFSASLTTETRNTGTLMTTGASYAFLSNGQSTDYIVNAGVIVGDVLLGANNDRINTVAGTITGRIFGNDGNDIYVLGADDVEIMEQAGEGTDAVYANASHVLADHVEELTLRGGARDGTGNAADNLIFGNRHANVLAGLDGEDQLFADTGSDRLDGGAGNDYLAGGAGIDTILGGDGDDRIFVSEGADTVNGGAGYDSVAFGGSIGLTVDLTAGTATGGHRLTAIENVEGTAQADTITGSSVGNQLDGEDGDDTLIGLAGNDILIGGDGADTMNGGEGTDVVFFFGVSADLTIDIAAGSATGDAQVTGDTWIAIEGVYGGAGDDTITGSAGANLINGYIGDDTILGGAGNDTIEGSIGDDTLTGGSAGDRFVFGDIIAGGGGWGDDTITDFTNGQDRIDLRGDSRVDGLASLGFSQAGGDVLIMLGTDTIRLSGTMLATIDAGDFLFA